MQMFAYNPFTAQKLVHYLTAHLKGADIMEMGGSASDKKIDPYVLAISIFAVACLAVAGTAVALYLEVRASPFHTVCIMHVTAYCHATLQACHSPPHCASLAS